MRTCPKLATGLKKMKADRLERSAVNQTVNLIDNFGDDNDNLDSEEEIDPDADQAANIMEINLADHCKASPIEDWYIDSGATKHVTGQKDSLTMLGPDNRSKVNTTGG